MSGLKLNKGKAKKIGEAFGGSSDDDKSIWDSLKEVKEKYTKKRFKGKSKNS